MMKIADPILIISRLALKRQKLLSATYHCTALKYAKDKEVVTTDAKKLELVEDRKKKEQLAKYAISSDIMSPPPPDEEMPNPRDENNRVDNRFVPRVYTVSSVSKSYTIKAEMIFETLASKPKNLQTFKKATELYLEKEGVYHRGMVEFVSVAMEKLKEYNVHLDLNAYKALLNVFPKGRLKPQGYWQAEFMHYPKQQDCAISLIDIMEQNFVMPDSEFGRMLAAVFGNQTYAYRKLQRTMYWMPKFANINPYPIPRILPEDDIELARLALKRMAFDINTELTIWQTNEETDYFDAGETSIVSSDVNNNQTEQTENQDQDHTEEKFTSFNDKLSTQVEKDALVTKPIGERHNREDTFIVSAQSPEQREIIRQLSTQKAVFVDGGFNVWLRHKQQTYFVLRAEPDHETPKTEVEDEDLFEWTTVFEEEKIQWIPRKNLHEQDDGVILAMCITGSSSRESLVTWIRHLQQTNPNLEKIPVIFTLKTEGQETALVLHGEKHSTGS